MNWKKTAKMLLFPHTAVRLFLIPLAGFCLVYSMVISGTKSIAAIFSYVLSAYTLVVWCVKIPDIYRFVKKIKTENKYIALWKNDTGLRINVSLYGTLVRNTVYVVLHLALGLWHKTFWFCSLAGYYFALAVMRMFLLKYTRKHKPGDNMLDELRKYKACGIILLIMNLSLSVIISFMVYWDRTFVHHEITAIVMAACTFTALTVAVVNVVKYRKYNSPVYSASKAISLAAACVSVLTLEATMLTTFGKDTMDIIVRRIMLGVSGGVVSVFIIVMAINMIAISNKKIRLHKAAEDE